MIGTAIRKVRAPVIALVLLAPLGLTACATPQQLVSDKEDHLAAAGFTIRPATTPQRQAMLDRLPPHRFVQRVHGDQVTYVYADPLVCDCLYVGSQQSYARYQQYLQQQRLADEQETTAQLYSDPGWDWGAWGPYDGFGPGFAYGPGLGW